MRAETAPDLKISGLAIWIDGRQFPESDDYWDANWLILRVRMEATGATVKCVGAILMTTNFEGFRDQLRTLYNDLEGTAKLAGLEPDLKLTLSGKGLGRIDAEVEITPDHLSQFHRFDFELDQSYLPDILSALDRLLEKYPVLHSEA